MDSGGSTVIGSAVPRRGTYRGRHEATATMDGTGGQSGTAAWFKRSIPPLVGVQDDGGQDATYLLPRDTGVTVYSFWHTKRKCFNLLSFYKIQIYTAYYELVQSPSLGCQLAGAPSLIFSTTKLILIL